MPRAEAYVAPRIATRDELIDPEHVRSRCGSSEAC
jgi:hypothetical protein